MAGDKITATDYITHHLQSLTSLSDVAKGQGLDNIADFSFINIDAARAGFRRTYERFEKITSIIKQDYVLLFILSQKYSRYYL